MSLPDDVWEVVHSMIESKGKYLFLAPVCSHWYSLTKSKLTNLEQTMASSSTIREAREHQGGKTLAKKNAWSFLARINPSTQGKLEELANELRQTIEWNEYSIITAAQHNNMNFFHWLRTTSLEWDPALALSSFSSVTFLKQMYKLGYVPDERCSRAAARLGSVEALRWLKEVGCDLRDVTQVLAEEGHLATLKWATQNGIPYDDFTLDAAAYAGKLSIVRYIVESGHKKPTKSTRKSAAAGAAAGGHSATLAYLENYGKYPKNRTR